MAQLRVVVFALLGNPLLVGGLFAALASQGVLVLPLVEGGVPVFPFVAVGVGVVLLTTAFVLRGKAFATARQEQDAAGRLRRYGQAMILFHGLVEGGVMLNLVGALLAAPPWPNLIAAGVLWAVQCTALPSAEHCADVTS